MNLQLLYSEFPYICGTFEFFYQCVHKNTCTTSTDKDFTDRNGYSFYFPIECLDGPCKMLPVDDTSFGR